MSSGGASPEDVVAAVRALTESNKKLSDQLTLLRAESEGHRRYGRRNRRMIWTLAVAVVLLLTAGIVVNSLRASNASDLARQVHATQVNTCQQSNTTRTQTIQLWDYILSIPPAAPLTAEQRKQRVDFKAYVHRVFAPRNCSKI